MGTEPSDAQRLWAAHGETLGRVCMALLGDGARAADAVVEAFAEAGAQPTRARLFGAARAACARRLEREATGTRDWADTKRDPISPSERIRVALSELKPTEREAVVLLVVGKLTPSEVAEASGTDEATARARASRGLSRLRAHQGDTR
jgi:DNA-directed RNA polymerase specialized sigma24 family protein